MVGVFQIGDSGGRPLLHAARVLLGRMRSLCNRVRLPDPLAGTGIEGAHAADGGAARVVRDPCLKAFPGRDRNIEPSLVQRGRCGHARGVVILDVRLPDLTPVLRVDGVGAGLEVTEEHRVADSSFALDRSHRHRVADTGPGAVRPVDAARGGIERIDIADIGADKDATGNHGRLPVGRRAPRIAESPFQFQTGNRRLGQPRRGRRLKAIVSGPVSPAVPVGSANVVQRRIARASIGHGACITRPCSAQQLTGQRLGHAAPILLAQGVSDRLHDSCRERGVDALGRHGSQGGWGRGALEYRVAMAGDAVLLEDRESEFGAVALGCGACRVGVSRLRARTARRAQLVAWRGSRWLKQAGKVSGVPGVSCHTQRHDGRHMPSASNAPFDHASALLACGRLCTSSDDCVTSTGR